MGLNSWTAQDKKKIDKVLEGKHQFLVAVTITEKARNFVWDADRVSWGLLGAKARFWNMYVEREQLNQYPDVLLRTVMHEGQDWIFIQGTPDFEYEYHLSFPTRRSKRRGSFDQALTSACKSDPDLEPGGAR